MMIQQRILVILLDILLNRELICESTCDRAKNVIYSCNSFPDFFEQPAARDFEVTVDGSS